MVEIDPVEILYLSSAVRENSCSTRVYVKPDRKQSAFGVARIDNEEELNRVIRATRAPIICEYLPGEKYTVDCFSDREHGVLFARARSRRRTDINEKMSEFNAVLGLLQLKGIDTALQKR